MASKIGKTEWWGVYALTGIIDIVQFIIDFFPPFGEAINEIADIVLGILLLAYFQLRGVSMFNKISRLGSLLGVGVLEELTGGMAPAWIIDVWYIHKTVKQEEVELQAQTEQEEMFQNALTEPLNRDGVRAPETVQIENPSETKTRNVNLKPLNFDGIRRANR